VADAVRTCVGCGRKAPQQEFLRFAAQDGGLIHDPKGSGRGAYTCRRLPCFERAVARRAFSRTLRQTVQIDQALSRLYTEDSNG
jgi:predicted RNA-binding protein YlxR (DUF448 family)